MSFEPALLPEAPRILIVRPKSIGDVVLATATFPVIKASLPGAVLDFAVSPPADQVLTNNPHLNEILLYKPRRGSLVRDAWSTLQFIRELRRRHYDMVIDLHCGPRAALITRYCGSPVRAGFGHSRRAGAYNVRVDPQTGAGVSAVRFYTSFLEELGFSAPAQRPRVYPTGEERKGIDDRLRGIGIAPGEQIAILHPGVRFSHNAWPPDRFARLVDHFQDRHGLKLVIDHAPWETEQVQAITTHVRSRAFVLQTSIRELVALASRARFLVGNDGGALHIAAAAGTPVFGLFGSTAPDAWIPEVEPHAVFYANLDCSPCTRKTRFPECSREYAACKTAIHADDVIREIEHKLGL